MLFFKGWFTMLMATARVRVVAASCRLSEPRSLPHDPAAEIRARCRRHPALQPNSSERDPGRPSLRSVRTTLSVQAKYVSGSDRWEQTWQMAGVGGARFDWTLSAMASHLEAQFNLNGGDGLH